MPASHKWLCKNSICEESSFGKGRGNTTGMPWHLTKGYDKADRIFTTPFLLPFDGAGWLGRNIKDHPVNPPYLVNYPVGNAAQQVIGQF